MAVTRCGDIWLRRLQPVPYAAISRTLICAFAGNTCMAQQRQLTTTPWNIALSSDRRLTDMAP